LDCFAGIGTSLLVAHELGRRAIGIEISQGYSEIAAAKLTAQAEELTRRERDANLKLGLEEETP
jgi:DNA modification methylase